MRRINNITEKQQQQQKKLVWIESWIDSYNQGNKLSGQMRKTALCLTPQAIENSFKRAYGEVEDISLYI